MELRHLKYFVTVAELLHFGRAADRLHIVQSALSRQIQDLESELQTQLLIRDSRNVRLTEVGAVFYEEAKAILSKRDRAIQLVRSLAQGYRGRLKIGFVGMAGASGVLPSFLTFFRARHPQLLIELMEAENHTQLRRLEEGELDVAIVTFPDNASNMTECHPLQASRWVMGMSADDPLSAHRELTAPLLQDRDFILYGNPDAESAQRALIASLLGAEPHIVNYANSTLSTLTLLAAGYGIALVPESMRQVGVPGVIFRPLCGLTQTVDVSACVLRNNTSPQVAHFLSALTAFRAAAADLSVMAENGSPDTRESK
ncbi:LysR substrate-binding domain-containing protein [Pluralibacter gergoviae]|uniref:LysR substrate-binding domain-containing protein n=1 Tax=Pluralibacter gergoviae TaxID=61647 RepID=A0AAW8HLR8_PLUGE|nr:LysR substrate-binding domain-containing protein [Pluralibacter gergoviae]MCK1065112.1 LysR substrate-binding domain-containing protein [Pluralibacter gergoviae]MCV7758203.1 LysR substrate-binding domain-containing protein [Pluralibacter gergoviae]MDQ2309402.1 LysR substrate-binding domain-containing protein [Pluralibacter gergoviae]PHH47056.1 LysR family transcriptional regulator [Pluralibacter gergoviae]HDS1117387.1 LysR family transcriptional regulator [Pluralibacter gergoviae]